MRNNPTRLFVIGVIVGVAMMIAGLGLQHAPGILRRTPASTATSASLPRLIALEATSIPARPTETALPPTPTSRPPAESILPTDTPLSLRNKQQQESIGYSVGGRSIDVYTFGSGEHERMIVADIHGGDEWNTLTLANQLIQYIDQHPDVIPADVTLYILPTLNPDGERRSHTKYGRLNQSGVDLNRNFPINWLADWDRSGCWNYLTSSGGTAPGSEPETQALIGFLSTHKIEALISYHSAALGIFPGGDPWDASSVRLAQSIAGVSSYAFPPLDTGCTYSGSLPDYAVSLGIAGVDVELTNHIETDFEANLDILHILLAWQ